MNGVTKTEVLQHLARRLLRALPAIPGYRPYVVETLTELTTAEPTYLPDISIEWDDSFGVGCDLRIRLAGIGGGWKPSVEISWSGMTRTPSEAVAAAALYAQVAALACSTDAWLARVRLVDAPAKGGAL